MITAAEIPVRPTNLFPKPTSNRHFSVSLLCSYRGFGSKQGLEQSRLLISNQKIKKMELIQKLSRGCFRNRPRKGQKVEIESVDGGEDLFDAASAEAKVGPEHLVIMVNGIVGSAADWGYAAEQFVKKLPNRVIVHRSESNYAKLTLEGVDLMGERLAGEVLDVIQRWPNARKISFVAHSLGGLVSRYAIGRLYGVFPKMETSAISGNCLQGENTNYSRQPVEQCLEDRIATFEPMNFITFATPHLGSRGHRQPNLLVKDKKYPHIVHVERDTPTKESSSMAAKQPFDLEEKMIQGLTQVPWERVDVSFHESKQRHIAHNTILVKSYYLNSDGADVVHHMIDNFLL